MSADKKWRAADNLPLRPGLNLRLVSDTNIPLNEEAPEHEHLPAAFERRIPLVPLLAFGQLAAISVIFLFVL